MNTLDLERSFIAIRIALLTISDTRTQDTDRSSEILSDLISDAGHIVITRSLVKDDYDTIVTQLTLWLTDPMIDIILATGGTGVTARDVTPEAFRAVYDKEIEGFGELFRMLSFQSIGTSTIQSRATAGVARGKYLFALPGSPGACRDAWNGILKYQLDNRQRPCNFVELMPRLME